MAKIRNLAELLLAGAKATDSARRELINNAVIEVLLLGEKVYWVTGESSDDVKLMGVKRVDGEVAQILPLFTSEQTMRLIFPQYDAAHLEAVDIWAARDVVRKAGLAGAIIDIGTVDFQLSRENLDEMAASNAQMLVSRQDAKIYPALPRVLPDGVLQELCAVADELGSVSGMWLCQMEKDGRQRYLVVTELTDATPERVFPRLGEVLAERELALPVEFAEYSAEFAGALAAGNAQFYPVVN